MTLMGFSKSWLFFMLVWLLPSILIGLMYYCIRPKSRPNFDITPFFFSLIIIYFYWYSIANFAYSYPLKTTPDILLLYGVTGFASIGYVIIAKVINKLLPKPRSFINGLLYIVCFIVFSPVLFLILFFLFIQVID